MPDPAAHRTTTRTLTATSQAIPRLRGEPALEPVRLAGHEGVNSLFDYELLLKTPDALDLLGGDNASWDLDGFIGREISCSIALDGAGRFLPGATGAPADRIGRGTRQINALITDARFLGEEGRHVQYLLTLRPWLHLATETTDCRIFQNMNVVQVIDALLAPYGYPVDKRLVDAYPQRDHQTQFNESDHAFFERLCQAWGISYFFEHGDGAHRLVLVDSMGAWQPNPSAAYRHVDYHPPGWKAEAEYIHRFTPHHQLTSGRYATRDYDHTRPRADLGASRSDPRPTGHADGEVYQWHDAAAGAHYAQPSAGSAPANDPHAEGRQLALLRMQALRTHGARAQASGNLRGMVPGCSFSLQAHPRQQANAEYLILDTRLLIEDVAQDSQTQGADRSRTQQWTVEVDLTAHPMTEMLRPALVRPRPDTGGVQTALVVGPTGESSATGAGENLWTDALGRIKVQFPWDREGQKNQHSSCWVRVSSPNAGNQLGAVFVPRIGQEVLIGFLGGNADLPVCTGRLHNQNNLPPWTLPTQAALSGIRSRELTPQGGNSAAGRSNDVVLDDTAGQIQVQARSDHLHSQLSLGHITRIEDNAGRQDFRGEGFELRSDGHGAVRAKEGLLLSTEGRDRARGHVKSVGETLARLEAGHDQHARLSDAARNATAHAPGDQDEVAQALARQVHEVAGRAGAQAAGIRSGSAPASASPPGFPEFAAPHLTLASAAGIQATAARSVHLASGEHTAITSGAHTSISTGKSLLVSVQRAIRLFAEKAGLRFTAAGEDIDFTALRSNINLLAKLDITLTADRITLRGTHEIRINGGSSYTRWNARGIEHGTLGGWVEHAASHGQAGPRSARMPSPYMHRGEQPVPVDQGPVQPFSV